MPYLLITLAFGMLVSYLPGILPSGIGGSISFLGWLSPLLGSLWCLMKRPKVKFPFLLWLPWTLWILSYLVFSEAENSLQRSAIILTPLIVGLAFSTIRINDRLIITCHLWMNIFLLVFILAAAISTGLASGALYDTTGFAAGSITASLLACWYAANYVITNQKKSLFIWLVLSVVPVLAVTRTGMAAVALTLPLTLAPWSWTKRLIAIGLLAFGSLAVFQSERIQSKMFFSGQGSLEDAVVGLMDMLSGTDTIVQDFATSGRSSMNSVLIPKLNEAYWLGHGANTTEAISFEVTGVTHPHNDWLRLRYEYGYLGMIIFGLTMLVQAYHGWRCARKLRSDFSIFSYTGSAAFLPMAVFMFSDNVIMYAAWFGNLQFALLGLGYAALNMQRKQQRLNNGENH